jgi:hypothetical protein
VPPNLLPEGEGEPELESERSSSTFRDFLTLGAGLSPAEGSVKPTAGFTFNQVICSLSLAPNIAVAAPPC